MDFWNNNFSKSNVIGGFFCFTMLTISHFIVKEVICNDTINPSESLVEEKNKELLLQERENLIEVQKRLVELRNVLQDLFET